MQNIGRCKTRSLTKKDTPKRSEGVFYQVLDLLFIHGGDLLCNSVSFFYAMIFD